MSAYNLIYQVDAFTDSPFKGNPAGVILLYETVEDSWMQSIAAEMNLSETAFLIQEGAAFHIRFFTPTVEIPLCGHATLASAHILYELGKVNAHEKILFHAKGGDLEVSKEADWIVMNFPAYPIQKIETPTNFKTLVGFTPIEVYSSSYGWIIAVAASENEILNASPTFEHLTANSLGHLMITSTGNNPETDFVVRCFAPSAGINEDPVTGSAQCALVPLWHLKTGNTSFNVIQRSKRTGILKVKAIENRVEIKGQAITIFKAHLTI